MIDLVYGRDILLSLDRGQGPSTPVKERLRRLGISVTGRRRRGYSQRSVAAGSGRNERRISFRRRRGDTSFQRVRRFTAALDRSHRVRHASSVSMDAARGNQQDVSHSPGPT